MTCKVIDFMSHADAAQAVPLQTKMEAYQRVIREWSAHLGANEYIALMAIVDRTIGWGKREVHFPVNALIHGDSVYARLPIKRTAIFDALASLEAKGFIHRRRDRVKQDCVHFSVNLNWKPGVAPLPKRLQGIGNGSVTRTSGSAARTTPSVTRTLYTVSNTVISNGSREHAVSAHSANEPNFPFPEQKEGKPQAPSPRPRKQLAIPAVLIREKVTQANAVSDAQRADESVGRSRFGNQAISAMIESAWRGAIIESFPHNTIPAWGGREKSQARAAAGKWLHRDQINFQDFAAWAATNWTAIMRQQFKWMTREPAPAVPSWNFFINFLAQFQDCHATGKLEKWLSDSDRTEVERLMGKGLTWEQATAQLSEAKAAGALRSEMEKREIVVAAKDRAADAKLSRAQKLADYAGNAPVHPRSRAAMRMRREAERASNPISPSAPPPGDFQGFVPAPLLPERSPYDDAQE